eukprot:m.216057 g.216057  ORF g.216057 m.216057 type:complete len:65 (+) comp26218_c0_seq3:1926-2120(+)
MSRNKQADDLPLLLLVNSVRGIDCGEEAALWVSDVLGRQCRLVRQVRFDYKFMCTYQHHTCKCR